MELRHLITFQTIVETGGFKRAADELGYAQSSVTAHIKELEKELDVPLFDRLGQSITLTEAGNNFLPYARDIIHLYSKSKEVVSVNGPTGKLVIGASESLMIYWLPDLLMAFMEKYPRIDLTLKSLRYDDMEAQLRQGHIDVALVVETADWSPPKLAVTKVKQDHLTHIQTRTKHANDRLLVTEYTCSWRPIVESYAKQQTHASHFVELPSIEAIKKCVLCGLGASILPNFVLTEEQALEEFLVAPLTDQDQKIGIYSATHADKWLSPNVKEFLGFVTSWEENQGS